MQAPGNAIPNYPRGPPLMLILGLASLGVMAYGKRIARGEEEGMLQLLQDTFDAQVSGGEGIG